VKMILFVAAATMTAVPAFAQSPAGMAPSDVAPRYSDRDQWNSSNYTNFGDCRLVEDRIVTPSGRVIFRTHRECD
jgi:hypothetical protein